MKTSTLPSLQEAVAVNASLAYFDLGLTKSEISALDKLKITKPHDVALSDKKQLSADISGYLKNQGNDEDVVKKLTTVISRIVKQTCQAFGADSFRLDLRASLPNDFWDTPRWHIDGYYNGIHSGDDYKVALSLKGAATLFNTVSGKDKQIFVDELRASKDQFGIETREKLAKMLDPSLIETPPLGAGVVFASGSDKKAAVHSEPPVHAERLFMAVIPYKK